MIESNNPDLSRGELMARVKKELEGRKPRTRLEPSPRTKPKDAPVAPKFPSREIPVQVVYHVRDFLQYNDEAFVRNGYWGVLGRPPDATGVHSAISKLRSGDYSKVEILGKLRISREGLFRKVWVRGLQWRFAAAKLARVPVIGYLVSLGGWIVLLPRLVRNLRRIDAYLYYQENRVSERLESIESALSELSRQIGDHAEGPKPATSPRKKR